MESARIEMRVPRLYAASENGTVAVFSVARDHSVAELGRSFLGPNAHSVSVDAATHRLYFPLESVHGRPTLRVLQATGAPASE